MSSLILSTGHRSGRSIVQLEARLVNQVCGNRPIYDAQHLAHYRPVGPRCRSFCGVLAPRAKNWMTREQVEAKASINQKYQELQIKSFEAETDRYKADIDRAKALSEIQGNQAQAAKLLAEAEAQDIENDLVSSGVQDLIQKASKINGQAVAQ